MGVKHGLGIACFAFVIGFGLSTQMEDGTMIFCSLCAMPLTLAGIGFFIPDRPNNVIVQPYTPIYSGHEDIPMSFQDMDTDGDGVISQEEYNQ